MHAAGCMENAEVGAKPRRANLRACASARGWCVYGCCHACACWLAAGRSTPCGSGEDTGAAPIRATALSTHAHACGHAAMRCMAQHWPCMQRQLACNVLCFRLHCFRCQPWHVRWQPNSPNAVLARAEEVSRLCSLEPARWDEVLWPSRFATALIQKALRRSLQHP